MASYQGSLGSIRDSVIQKLRLDESDNTAMAEVWINLAYQEAVQATGCLQTQGTAALTSGTSSYDLPAPVAWIKLLTVTYTDGSVSDPYQQVTLEQILEQRRVDTAAPTTAVVRPLYALAGQNLLELWPTPGAGQTLAFWYVYLPEELSADGDEPAIMEPYGSKLLEYGALVEGARFKKDPILPDYEAAYSFWLARFQRWLTVRQGASPLTFQVGRRNGLRVADRSADVGA